MCVCVCVNDICISISFYRFQDYFMLGLFLIPKYVRYVCKNCVWFCF